MTWFWSRWGAVVRASAGMAHTRGITHFTGAEDDAHIDRTAVPTLTFALVHAF